MDFRKGFEILKPLTQVRTRIRQYARDITFNLNLLTFIREIAQNTYCLKIRELLKSRIKFDTTATEIIKNPVIIACKNSEETGDKTVSLNRQRAYGLLFLHFMEYYEVLPIKTSFNTSTSINCFPKNHQSIIINLTSTKLTRGSKFGISAKHKSSIILID